MADETPDAPAAEPKPAPRRRGPNKPKPEGAPKATRKPRAAKSVAETVANSAGKVEQVVAEAVKAPVASVTATGKSAAKVVKPRAGKRGTPRPAPKARGASKTKKGWGTAALAGGLAAAGAAATAAVLALRGSSRKPAPPKLPAFKPEEKKAHQPDGTDSSKSFSAGIADESTVPDKD